MVTLGLTSACLLMMWAPALFVLGLAIYTLRLFGQGLTGHTSATAMARYFERSRGTALSIAALGYPIGEALFPYAAVSMLTVFSPGQTWGLIALVVLLVITPLSQYFLIGHGKRHANYVLETSSWTGSRQPRQEFSRRDVLRDQNFYIILSVILAPAFIVTGIFFHQVHLVDIKGGELSHFAAAFVAFAACQLGSSLVTGPTIDRSNAVRLLAWFLAPLFAGLIVLASFESAATIIVFMMLAGTTSGASTTISGALWAEVYGVTHIGAIKAMATALMVVATALSPAILGWLIDGGVSFGTILYAMALYVVTASLFARFWFRNGVR